jgi:WD40 repeat protein
LLKWSPNGESLAAYTNKNALNSRSRITIWDVDAEEVRFILESFDVPSWSADGAAVIVNGQAWDALTGQPVEILEAVPAAATPSAVPYVTYSEDIAQDDIYNLQCQTVHVRLLGSVPDQYRLPESEINRYGCYRKALISPDNRLLLVDFSTWVYQTVYDRLPLIPEGGIGIYNILTGQRVGWLNVDSNHVSDIVFNPDGSLLASGSTDGTIILWDMTQY